MRSQQGRSPHCGNLHFAPVVLHKFAVEAHQPLKVNSTMVPITSNREGTLLCPQSCVSTRRSSSQPHRFANAHSIQGMTKTGNSRETTGDPDDETSDEIDSDHHLPSNERPFRRETSLSHALCQPLRALSLSDSMTSLTAFCSTAQQASHITDYVTFPVFVFGTASRYRLFDTRPAGSSRSQVKSRSAAEEPRCFRSSRSLTVSDSRPAERDETDIEKTHQDGY
ncbi:hypothetical protein VTI74DRAFT_11012 [Chaetomium olivicolor]